MTSHAGWGQKAPHACSPCRKKKKACDKNFPSCSSCVRLHRDCSYDSGLVLDVGSLESLNQRLTKLEDEMSEHRAICEEGRRVNPVNKSTFSSQQSQDATVYGSSTFPSTFFLDINVFRHRGMHISQLQMDVEVSTLEEIGSRMEIQTIVGTYFFSVAPWISVISRKRIYEELFSDLVGLASDVAFLVLCMKLLADNVSSGQTPRTKLWTKTKNRFLSLLSSGFASIRLLQARILFCLYETGHAIYPEAYISIGHLGRLGQAIGLHDTAGIPQLALEPATWDEMEERRRVWWAVWILDRHMNIGNPSRSLALAESGRREYLPVDDVLFERGEKTTSEPLFVSSSTNIVAAPLARLCQASHLLSLVLTHVNDTNSSAEVRLEEAKQLSRAILALSSFMSIEIGPHATRIFVPKAVCLSALFALYEHSAKVRQGAFALPTEFELYQLGASGLHSLVPLVAEYATHIQTILPYNLSQASPLVCNCLYRTAVWISSLAVEEMRPDYSRLLLTARDALQKLSVRWKLAEEYLKMLDCLEPIHSIGEAMSEARDG